LGECGAAAEVVADCAVETDGRSEEVYGFCDIVGYAAECLGYDCWVRGVW
jgi:hypothetical protein